MFLLLSLLAIHGNNLYSETKVDLIEYNHCRVNPGHGYDQVILWEWCPEYRRHDVIGWFIPESSGCLPIKSGDRWLVRHVSRSGRISFFSAKVFRETWTSYDPERRNQALRKETDRSGTIRARSLHLSLP